jgi:hypothetical protein
MERKKRVGILVAGAIITLAMVSAACSGPSTNEVVLPETVGSQRSITVYESPT